MSSKPIQEQSGGIQSEKYRQNRTLVNTETRTYVSGGCICSAFDYANVGMCLMDLEGHLFRVNQHMCDMFGYSRDEFEGMNVNDITHPDFLVISPNYMKQALNGEVIDGEFQKKYIHKNGRIVWGQVSSSLVRDQEGQPQYFITYIRQINDIKQIEHELRKERNFSSAILSTAGAMVVVLDRQGRIVRFNRACEKLTGFVFQEVEGKCFWDLFLIPSEIDPVKAVFEDLRSGVFPNEHENYWVTKHGSRRLIKWSNTSLTGPDGSVEYVIGTGIDITDARAAEEKLQKSEKKYRTLLANLDTAVVVHAPDTRILISNLKAQELLGLSEEDLTNRKDNDSSWHLLRDDGTKLPVQDYPVNIVGTTFKPLKNYLVGINHPGHRNIVWAEVNAFPELDDNGNMQQIVVTFWDVTKRKLAEDALAKRTVDLADSNKQLRLQINEREQVEEKLRFKQRQADKELEVAAKIQQTLIPRYSPRIESIRFAWRFEPSERIGGDIFNFQYTGKNHISFYMFDVCGHGVSSALIATAISQYLQTSFSTMLTDPATARPEAVLNDLERTFPFERFDSFFTIVYLTIDYTTGWLFYASAGHPPPIIASPDGSLRILDVHGPVVGTGSVDRYFRDSVHLKCGDKVIIYTDGILDYSNPRSELFGKERLLTVLGQFANSPIQNLMDRVEETIKDFAGDASPNDDASIMAIEYLG